jgi:hypothetical protein
MASLINPDEVITAIANLRHAGDTEENIAKMVIQAIEDQAKRILKANGFAPIHSFDKSKRNPSLTADASQRRQLWERNQWLNEAIQLDGCGIFGIEQAAVALREADAIRFCIDQGETLAATIAAFNLLACALLPADTKQAQDIIRLPLKKQKERGARGGKNKAGYEGPIKQYVRRCCDEFGLEQLKPKQAAARIINLFENEEELEPYHSGETCPIVVLSFDRDTQTLIYSESGKSEKEKTADFDRITRIIRDLTPKKTKKTK